MSTPISFSSKPRLFGDASVPKHQEKEHPHQRLARKKSKLAKKIQRAEPIKFAPGLIKSPQPDYQTRKNEFRFSEGGGGGGGRGGDSQMASISASLIDSPPPVYQTRNTDFRFSKDENEGEDGNGDENEGEDDGGDEDEDENRSVSVEDEGGDAEAVSIAGSLIDSPPHVYQTKNNEFRFSEDIDEGEDENEGEDDGGDEDEGGDAEAVSLKKIEIERTALAVAHMVRQYLDKQRTGDNEPDYESTAGSDGSDGDDSDDDYCLDSVIDRGLFRLPCTSGLVKAFKATVKSNVLRQLRAVIDKEPTAELFLEVGDSIDLLRLLGASTRKLDDVGGKARRGAKLYIEGLKVMNEGQDLLRSCLSDISSLK